MSMSDDLKAIEAQVKEGLASAESMDALEALRVGVLGRKGSLTAIMHTMGKVPPEERPAMGQLANTVRANVDMAIKTRKEELGRAIMAKRMEADAVDVTLPGRQLSLGTQHLISQIREEIEDIFAGLGYTVEDGPYIETTYYNFTALNAPEDHPSRSAKDTFYVVDNQPKNTGWLEILGCGMVDPNVFVNCGIDPEKYTGFAFGIGVERVAALRYDLPDLRMLMTGDMRFLKQF